MLRNRIHVVATYVTDRLLRSQLTAIQDAIKAHALSEEDFVWEEREVFWTSDPIPALVHVSSGFSFSLHYNREMKHLGRRYPAGFKIMHAPGIQEVSDEIQLPTWDGALERFGLWLDLIGRELGRPGIAAPSSEPASRRDRHRSVWALLHPEIVEIAGSRFDSNQLADSVEAALKHVNEILRRRCRDLTGEDLDGAKLMKRLFSPERPILAFGDLTTQTGKSMQAGYMELFAGAMMGIRNPKAHANIAIDERRALHFLVVASLLRFKIDETTVVNPPAGAQGVI